VANEGTLGSTVIQSESVQGVFYEVNHLFEYGVQTTNVEMNNHCTANQLRVDFVSKVLIKRVDLYQV
jgi:hypothetical protein